MKRTTKILNTFVTIFLLTMFLSCATFKSFLEAKFTGDNIAGFIFADGQSFELTSTKMK